MRVARMIGFTYLEFTEDQMVPARELNRRPGNCLDRAQQKDLIVQREGRSIAALVGYQRYRMLRKLEIALEDAALILEARRRLKGFASNPAQTYSLDDVLAENGLSDDEVEG